MPVTAPAPVSAVAGLLKVAALGLPLPGNTAASAARPADELVLAPPPTLQAMVQLAATGQHNLATLLPTLQRMLVANPEPLPLGHLSRAVGDAAHWIDAGAARLLATDASDLTPAWRQIARAGLHQAADLLTRAEQHLDTIPQQRPDTLWAMSQVAGAQRQVGLAIGTLSARPRAAAVNPSRPNASISRVVGLFGMALMLLLLAVADGTWLAIAALAGTFAALAWVWRIIRLSRDLKLEIRH
jgi:hypothetical protein